MSSPIQQLIESIRDGFLLLAEDGGVRYANAPAKVALGSDLGSLAASRALRAALRAHAAGTLKLPHAFKLDLNGGQRELPAVLISPPVGATPALLVQPAVAEANAPGLANVLELIRGKLLRPMQALRASLKAPADSQEHATATIRMGEIADELEKLVEFAAVFGEDRLNATDRIVISDLIGEVWKDLSSFAGVHSVEVSMVGFGQPLPPVYGNRDWLRRAVFELLDNAIRHCGSHAAPRVGMRTQIEISARQLGLHVVLTIRNAGIGLLPKVVDRVYLPFNTATTQRRDGRRGLALGLPLVHKLVELHGGRLKIGMEGGEEVECVIELPTGAPQHDAARLDLLQAKRYAEDLGKLLARRKKKPASTAKTEVNA